MDHSFWELENGTSENFWSDSWKQLPALNTDSNLRDLIPLTTVAGLHRVIDFWKPFDLGELWHTWKNTHELLNIPPIVDL